MSINLAKVLGTFVVWAGIDGLCWLLGSLHVLSGEGAGLMIFVGFIATIIIWAHDQ